jgi:hypothetical protein
MRRRSPWKAYREGLGRKKLYNGQNTQSRNDISLVKTVAYESLYSNCCCWFWLRWPGGRDLFC